MIKKLFLDLETSGLYPNKHAILEIAGIYEVDGHVVDEFHSNVRPWEGSEIDPKALKINNVKNEEIHTFPEHIEVFDKFMDFAGGFEKVTIYGYNPSFDVGFLRKWFIESNSHIKTYNKLFTAPIDVLSISVDTYLRNNPENNLSNYKLKTLLEAYQIEYKTEELHNAMTDIRLTRELYYRAIEWGKN